MSIFDPTTFKNSDFGRVKEGNLISTRSWRSVAVQLPGGSSERFRTQLLNDAQGKSVDKWSQNGLKPGSNPDIATGGLAVTGVCERGGVLGRGVQGGGAPRGRPAQRENLGIIGC